MEVPCKQPPQDGWLPGDPQPGNSPRAALQVASQPGEPRGTIWMLTESVNLEAEKGS